MHSAYSLLADEAVLLLNHAGHFKPRDKNDLCSQTKTGTSMNSSRAKRMDPNRSSINGDDSDTDETTLLEEGVEVPDYIKEFHRTQQLILNRAAAYYDAKYNNDKEQTKDTNLISNKYELLSLIEGKRLHYR